MFKESYWLRDTTNKAVRRVKKLIGKPDPTPWVLRPQARPGAQAYVDLVVGLDFLNNNATLTKMFAKAMAPYGLSLLVANKENVDALKGEIEAGKIKPHVYLDLCSAIDPRFAELLETASKAGVYTIGQPEKLEQWTWKARAQKHLEQAGLPVPPTVVIKAGEPARELTGEEARAIGEKCVIKPSFGVAGKGVVANVKPTAAAIAEARRFDPNDDFLVQRMVKWEKLGGRTAYLRGYNILGTRTLLWWAPESLNYDICSWDDVKRFDLLPALELMDRMVKLTGMDYFSSEIAITSGGGQPRFVLIDYCNDQCDLNPKSAQLDGPPDEWVQWVCERFAEFVWRKKFNIAAPTGHNVWLGGSSTATAPMKSRMPSAA